MATEHDDRLAQGEIYALGALDGQELRDFEAHLAAGCAICEAHIHETRQALALIPQSLEPRTPPASIKNEIVSRIAGQDVSPTLPKPEPSRRRWRVIAGTVAAGVVGAVVAGGLLLRRYEPRHTVYTAVIELLRDPATKDIPLHGAGPAPRARGRFLWNESGEGHIFVSNLPLAPRGKMYAVWTIGRDAAPRYVGTVESDASGQGGLHIKTAGSVPAVETFAVSLEPLGSTSRPTGPIVLSSR